MEKPDAGRSALKEFQHAPVDQQQRAADHQRACNFAQRDFLAEHEKDLIARPIEVDNANALAAALAVAAASREASSSQSGSKADHPSGDLSPWIMHQRASMQRR